ncbi:2-phytyl-1 4-beta-naphthoquinone methyltransferase chloroplastic [Phtheirospermum japonicum]|uniref:2-phytyl-1 4-beta-naphthoquinone methyltransferase chloroplastic n=1 Tax=Phtheirospermum japonicum TaxID=374723 RepID=A0A830DE02_9LAMI|nr:2-phytyl-1 4-beta-naphthoquinone methyltransferase chloroplastic [Phtheirospermum japonicum]
MEEDGCFLERSKRRIHCVRCVLWKWGFSFSLVRESWKKMARFLLLISQRSNYISLHLAKSSDQRRATRISSGLKEMQLIYRSRAYLLMLQQLAMV